MRERLAVILGVLFSAALAAFLLVPGFLHPPARARRSPTLGPIAPPLPSSPSSPPADSTVPAPVPVADSSSPSPSSCPAGMRLAHGAFCPFVAHQCRTRAKKGDACAEFKGEVLCEGTIRDARFCIDAFEYPNVRGVLPAVLVTFPEARHACETEGKRVCTVDEWQFACEGSMILPLPEGLRRDGGCNVDAADQPPLLGAMGTPFEYAKEIMRVDGRVPAGSREACKSPFGAYDMAGNVAEWTENPLGGDALPPFRSSVAGGSFGHGEASCRTLDTTVPDAVRSHRIGFRCCADAGPRPPGDVPVPSHRSPGGFRPIGPGLP